MSELAMNPKEGNPAKRTHIWLLLSLAAFVVLAANAHLVYVAITSQPACVAHVKPGEADKAGGLFSAAKSSCSPLTNATGDKP